MLNLLIKPLLGVAGQAVSGFVETKKAKAKYYDLVRKGASPVIGACCSPIRLKIGPPGAFGHAESDSEAKNHITLTVMKSSKT